MGQKATDDDEGPTTRIKRYRATHKRVEIVTALLIVGIWIAVGAYIGFAK